MARSLGDRYRQVLLAHRRLLRAKLCPAGAELLTEGDSFFVAFADATAAVRACLDAQRALVDHPWPAPGARPRIRMGLHTGYAVALDGDYASAEVHRAARVAAAAHGDQVLCSQATAAAARLGPDARLVDLGRHLLRGFDDPIRLYQVVAEGLAVDFPPPTTVADRAHNLPAPLTRLVGRHAERVELSVLVGSRRLVTVWGTGGVGKTRLAVEVARELAGRYADGVWHADLAGAAEPDAVAPLLASALGLRPGCGQSALDAVTERLLGHDCLLLLDTCERQRAAVADLVARLLAGCPGVSVLATSRTPLGVPGELVWRLGPLPTGGGVVPGGPRNASDSGASGADAVSDAIELLSDRFGGLARPGFVAGADRLARQLAGLPLALELAAPLLRAIPPAVLADRLAGADPAAGRLPAAPGAATSVDGPLPARHFSMRANLDWSYQLLRPPAARLLRWLSGWPAGIDLAGVEWLTSDWLAASEVHPAVAELVDAGLLEADPTDSTVTYRLLAPLRAAARELAARTGELELARARFHRATTPVAHRPDRVVRRPRSAVLTGTAL